MANWSRWFIPSVLPMASSPCTATMSTTSRTHFPLKNSILMTQGGNTWMDARRACTLIQAGYSLRASSWSRTIRHVAKLAGSSCSRFVVRSIMRSTALKLLIKYKRVLNTISS
ncbi:hypothetical protein EMCG_05378 [[Emmonsia] crescens]|uniref:Secreted protein n=1 Tax=[Emmonsia] crescens TaxID=73230 RepID=A0A0G2J679_9EURO|nr:hypothetical protein EMCG_05378 [Emmonsia crescens UAMH 3008]